MKHPYSNQGEFVFSEHYKGYWIAKPFLILFEIFDNDKRPSKEPMFLVGLDGILNNTIFIDANELSKSMKISTEELIQGNIDKKLMISNKFSEPKIPTGQTMSFKFTLNNNSTVWHMDKINTSLN